jgi:hypothetical protein
MSYVTLRIRPDVADGSSVTFGAVNPFASAEHAARFGRYTVHEKRQRADYHGWRYLRHVSSDDLRSRVADIISNMVFVSRRNRYSANTLYMAYWRDRLAYTAEELALRGEDATIEDSALLHLPPLGFSTPTELAGIDQGSALFRYDKLCYVEALLGFPRFRRHGVYAAGESSLIAACCSNAAGLR